MFGSCFRTLAVVLVSDLFFKIERNKVSVQRYVINALTIVLSCAFACTKGHNNKRERDSQLCHHFFYLCRLFESERVTRVNWVSERVTWFIVM